MIKNEIDVLRKALKEDPEYYYSWQAAIAMSFKDLFHYQHLVDGKQEFNIVTVTDGMIHNLANEAAENFLNLLIKNPEEE